VCISGVHEDLKTLNLYIRGGQVEDVVDPYFRRKIRKTHTLIKIYIFFSVFYGFLFLFVQLQ
jgi:hypothetical protein